MLLMGWLIVGAVAVAAAGLVTPLRAGLGVVWLLVALRLPLLVRRHGGEIRTVAGLKRQYVTLGIVLAVLGAPAMLFFWWPSLAVAAIGAACAVAVVRIPVGEPTRRIDYDDPAAWDDASMRLLQRSPARFWGLVVGASLALFVAVVAGAALLAG